MQSALATALQGLEQDAVDTPLAVAVRRAARRALALLRLRREAPTAPKDIAARAGLAPARALPRPAQTAAVRLGWSDHCALPHCSGRASTTLHTLRFREAHPGVDTLAHFCERHEARFYALYARTHAPHVPHARRAFDIVPAGWLLCENGRWLEIVGGDGDYAWADRSQPEADERRAERKERRNELARLRYLARRDKLRAQRARLALASTVLAPAPDLEGPK